MFAAWSRVRRSKQPAAYARKVLLNRHLLEHPSPDRLPRSWNCTLVPSSGENLRPWWPTAWAGVEVTTRRVTVVQHADTTVLVHRVETALVVRTLEVARVWSADDERCPAARDNSGK
jgi:hypothetical protein